MTGSLALLLALATVILAAAGFLTRRVPAGNLALAAAGAGASGLLLVRGHVGLAIAMAAVSWSVAAAAQAMARLLDEVEARQETGERAHEPWLVALLSAGILTLSLAVATAAVDWPSRSTAGDTGAAAVAGAAVVAAADSSRAAPSGGLSALDTTLLALVGLAAIAGLLVLRRSLGGGKEEG